MMSAEQIRALSQEAAIEAAEENRVPFITWEEDLNTMPPFPFPFLGNYVPDGWELEETYFVDSSGFGQEYEPALTANHFLKKIKVGKGYAIREAGEFQVVVGEYDKVEG